MKQLKKAKKYWKKINKENNLFNKMRIEIITPDKTIFEGDVNLIQIPGIDGSFEILNNHAPLISVLKKGEIKITDKNKNSQFFEINGGVIEVLKNKVLILAE
jgi:F-type H+-transporting ATPase subunit epsilon